MNPSITEQEPSADARRAPVLILTAVFVLLVCLSLLAINVWQQWTARQAQLEEAANYSSTLARALAQHAEDSIEEAETVLIDVVERLEAEDRRPERAQRLQSMMKLHVAQLAQLHGLFVYDEKGYWIASSLGDTPENNYRGDREYFQFHRLHTDRGIHISAPIRSRSSGDWVIPVSRRLDHLDGSFAGVALATLYVKYFVDFYSSFNLYQQGSLVLALDNGTILLRRPFDEGLLGKRLPRPSGLTVDAMGVGTSIVDSPVDGIRRIVSRRPVEQYPLVIGASLAEEEVLSGWRSNAQLNAIVVLMVILVLLLLGALLFRQVRHGLRTEQELRNARDHLKLANQELSELALKDGLTGLANRRQFERTLQLQLAVAQRNQMPLALIMLDIDFFKRYNDTYGHPSGDACLRAIGVALMRNQHRPDDLCARYGGEEMVVLLPNTSLNGAMVVAERLRQAVLDLDLPHSQSQFGVVTISAGVHVWQAGIVESDTADLLVRRADQALYAAKFGGRNRVLSFDELPVTTRVE